MLTSPEEEQRLAFYKRFFAKYAPTIEGLIQTPPKEIVIAIMGSKDFTVSKDEGIGINTINTIIKLQGIRIKDILRRKRSA